MAYDQIVIRKASAGVRDAIYKEVQNRRSLYMERDTVMHRLRRYRLMRHKVYVPKAYQRQLGGERGIKMPITYRLVQTAVNAVAKAAPTVFVEPINATDQRPADELGRALNLLLQALENQSHVPFLYSLYYNLFGDGLGVTKTQRGPWAGFPLPEMTSDEQIDDPAGYIEKVEEFLANNPLPFVTRTVDPLTFYPPLDEYGRGVCMESGWRSFREVLQSLRLIPAKTSGGLTFQRIPDDKPWADLEFPPGIPPTMRVDEVWTKDECGVVIQGSQDVWIFENPTGQLPYTWGFAEPTGVHDPTNVGMSVVYPLYYLAPWIDTMVGVMTAWALFAAPTPYTTQDPIPGLPPTKDQKIEMFNPGKMYHFPTGRKPGILAPPPVGDSVLGFLNFLIEAADRGGLPALVSGSGVGSRLPALTFQAAFEAATDRLQPAVQSAQHVIAGTLRKMLDIVGESDIPVKVNGWDYEADPDNKRRSWAVIRPAEARKQRPITVTLAVDSTQDLIAKGTHAQFMVSAQLMDIAAAMRFAGIKDVQKMKDGIAADTAWRAALPALAQAILNQDPDFQALQAQQAEQEAAAEGQGGGGTTQEPPMSEEAAAPVEGYARGGIFSGQPADIGGDGKDYPGKPPGPGRNRAGVPAGRGGGRRGTPTHKPRGAGRSAYGKT